MAKLKDTRLLERGPHLEMSILFVAFVVAVVGSLGAPLITSVATSFHVTLASAQWTLTIPLLTGSVATPFLGRLGAGPHRRGAVLSTLLILALGSLLTVAPLPFAWLIIGRGIQGAGLGLPALMMGVARDHVSKGRTASVISLISVASTMGVGIGYPLVGLMAEIGGVRLAYALGALVAISAFFVALRTIPLPPQGRSSGLDVYGAVLLAVGLFPILLVASETSLWTEHASLSIGLLAIAVVLLIVWWMVERRVSAPLVDVRLLRHRAVTGANVAMLIGGMGMYLLLTLMTRYAQTPESAGYGFGLSTFLAGLVLVPFAFMGFVAAKIVPSIRQRLDSHALLSGSAAVVLLAFLLFGIGRSNIVVLLLAMATLGFGVGSFSAAMPAVILVVTPKSETSSAMSFNLVVRAVGFSLGSALCGLMLESGTVAGHVFPKDVGYSSAGWIGAAAIVATVATTFIIVRSHRAPPGDLSGDLST